MVALGSWVVEKIKNHYTIPKQVKSANEEKKDKFILKCIPFNRWYLVPAAIIVQLCIGQLYAWSVFNIPIENALNLEPGTSAISFYIAVCFFGLSAAIVGPVLEKVGPRKVLMFSSSMVFIGLCICAAGVQFKQIGVVYFGYGLFCGTGFGVSYITPVSPLQKWFPSTKGLMAGFAVCGFGGGSMVSSQIQKLLIPKIGIPLTFVSLAVGFFVCMFPMSFILRTPPNNYVEYESDKAREKRLRKEQADFEAKKGFYDDKGKKLSEPPLEFTLIQSLSSGDYWLMYVMFIANCCAGLMTISKFADIIQLQFKRDAAMAANMVSINAAFNLTGRLVYGALSDLIGQKILFVTSLTYQLIVCALLPTFIHTQAFWTYAVCFWILSSFYGGGFGLIPAFLTNMYGSHNIGALHGVILTGFSFIGIAGGLTFTYVYKWAVAKYGKNSLDVYDINFNWITVLIAIGLVCIIFVRTELRDRVMDPVKGQMFKVRIFGSWLVRCQGYGKEHDDEEYRQFLIKKNNMNKIHNDRAYEVSSGKELQGTKKGSQGSNGYY